MCVGQHQCFSQFLSTLFCESESLAEPGATDSSIPAILGIHLSLPPWAGIKDVSSHALLFCVGAVDLDLSPHASV